MPMKTTSRILAVLEAYVDRTPLLVTMLIGVLVGFLIAAAVGCTPRKPPEPPAPTPSPSPPALRTLRIEGTSIVNWTKGAVICCDNVRTPNVDEGLRDGWTGVRAEVADKFDTAGVRFTEVRTGPYVVEAAPLAVPLIDPGLRAMAVALDRVLRARLYPGEAGILPELRRQTLYLNSKGVTVQWGLVDNWALISGWNAYGDDCSVTKAAPPPRYIAWIDAVVSSSWDLDVWYNLGTEGFRCRPSKEWERGLYDAVKARLRQRGVDRPVGSELWIGQATDPTREHFDFATFSGIFEPPPKLEIPAILLEDNGNYHSPKAWKDLEAQGRQRGVYVVF